jgi:exosortase
MELNRKTLAGAAVVLAGFVLLYYQVLSKLIYDWENDGNYSHGFLIVPIALYLAWERRHKFFAAPHAPSNLGLLVVAGSVLVLLTGIFGAELFLTRISIVGTVVGSLLFLCGWARLRVLAFPVAFLLLMIPLPAIIFNQIAFPLQLLASQAGEVTLRAAEIPVLREGNVLVLANTKLEVAEACSGIRSLVSLITLAIMFGYFTDQRAWVRIFITLSAIPVAIVANAGRVAGTGIAAHYVGPEAAEGFFHEFSGWIVFLVAFALMMAIQRLVVMLVPPPRPAQSLASTAQTVSNPQEV